MVNFEVLKSQAMFFRKAKSVLKSNYLHLKFIYRFVCLRGEFLTLRGGVGSDSDGLFLVTLSRRDDSLFMLT